MNLSHVFIIAGIIIIAISTATATFIIINLAGVSINFTQPFSQQYEFF